jgi:tRNA-Thr(GGU) m(6)t(6)A37 methyltransferase TsaA
VRSQAARAALGLVDAFAPVPSPPKRHRWATPEGRNTTPISLHPIGRVVCDVTAQTDQQWGTVTSRIELLPEYRGGLLGLDQFSHVLVITYLHQAGYVPAEHLTRRPRGLPTMPLAGIFAQRAKDRPNPIGVTAVSILAVTSDSVVVRGLDAINGTPVLDLKPYYPQYDRIENAVVPEWVDRLMEGYF